MREKMRNRITVALRKLWVYSLPGIILGGVSMFAFPGVPGLPSIVALAVTCAVFLCVENLGYLPELKTEIETVKPKDGNVSQ